MLRAIYPGSFDPITNGHFDIIERAASISDELIVGVLQNKAKTPLFSVEERVTMLCEVTKNLKNVRIVPFEGLLVDFAKQNQLWSFRRNGHIITFGEAKFITLNS